MPKLLMTTILVACFAVLARGKPETGFDMIDQLIEEGNPFLPASCLPNDLLSDACVPFLASILPAK